MRPVTGISGSRKSPGRGIERLAFLVQCGMRHHQIIALRVAWKHYSLDLAAGNATMMRIPLEESYNALSNLVDSNLVDD